MPSFIVKPDPHEDFYVFWSTVVDAPTAWGTRKELEHQHPEPCSLPSRFARADKNGTSGLGFAPRYGWDEPAWMVRECTSETRRLPRKNLRAFCEAYPDVEKLMSLTEAYPDDE